MSAPEQVIREQRLRVSEIRGAFRPVEDEAPYPGYHAVNELCDIADSLLAALDVLVAETKRLGDLDAMRLAEIAALVAERDEARTERDYFQGRLGDFSAVAQEDFGRAVRAEEHSAVLQAALTEIVNAEPETFDGKTAWPSFAGRLENIAAVALSRAGIERTTP